MLVEWLQPIMQWFGFASILELGIATIIILLIIKD